MAVEAGELIGCSARGFCARPKELILSNDLERVEFGMVTKMCLNPGLPRLGETRLVVAPAPGDSSGQAKGSSTIAWVDIPPKS
jgi:hypothetical protein